MALPPPFVGRHAELARLREGLAGTSVLVVLGAVGSGKSRLVRELAASSELPAVLVRSWIGDRPEALRARAERALGITPGTFDRALREQSRLVVIDDAHHVHGGAAAAFGDLVRRPGNGRLLLVGREDLDLPTSGPTRVELHLEGLDPGAARELWAHLEETYGPTPAGSCDAALSRTRGLPLALRREYACAAAGKQAWTVERLTADAREALEVVAVVGGASVAPSGVAALAPSITVEVALIELVSRQLIDPLEDGRFAIHDVVRDQVLAGLPAARRAALERAAAELALRGPSDDGALGLVHPVDRLRAAVHHLLAADDRDGAEAVLAERGGAALSRSAGGELLGLIDFVRGDRPVPPPRLAELAAATQARRGRVAAALALGGPADPVERALLHFRAGDEAAARAVLEPLVGDGDPDVERTDLRARAAAAMVDIELRRGVPGRARALIESGFAPGLGDQARARLHLALAALEAYAGREASARAALSRAIDAARGDAALIARIEAARARCLLVEGRAREAEVVVNDAVQAATDVDDGGAADEAAAIGAEVRASRGDLVGASQLLVELAAARRAHGDEVGALEAEIEAAAVLVRRADLLAAAELADAAAAGAGRLGLGALRARAELVAAAVDVAAWRGAEARQRLSRLAQLGRGPAAVLAGARSLERRVATMLGEPEAGDAQDAPIDEQDGPSHALWLAAARGDSRGALRLARAWVSAAERSGNPDEMACALAWRARLELGSGDRAAAEVAAVRAAREAAGAGSNWARCQALLVLAALGREAGDVMAASSYARDAAEVATASGLPVERLVAERALAAIAGGGERTGARGPEVMSGAASLGEAAREAATRALADLGLTSVKPFRLVSADGHESRVADASPDRLRMAERDLVVDGVREVIVRSGRSVADLRRRSLLKRLLFLFAAQPGRTFSKEEIVQTVWTVDYHPLRHDAALFTNIMRIRRLLGRDGAELIRVSEDGYRFTPGKDFMFVEPVAG